MSKAGWATVAGGVAASVLVAAWLSVSGPDRHFPGPAPETAEPLPEDVLTAQPDADKDFTGNIWHGLSGTLAYIDGDQSLHEFCNATLEQPRFLVTAFHCLDGKADLSRIVFKTWNEADQAYEIYPLAANQHLNEARVDYTGLPAGDVTNLQAHRDYWRVYHQVWGGKLYDAAADVTVVALDEDVVRGGYPVMAHLGDLEWVPKTVGDTDFQTLDVTSVFYYPGADGFKRFSEACRLYRLEDRPMFLFHDCTVTGGVSGAGLYTKTPEGEILHIAVIGGAKNTTTENFAKGPFYRHYRDLDLVAKFIGFAAPVEGLLSDCESPGDDCLLQATKKVRPRLRPAELPDCARVVTPGGVRLRSGPGVSFDALGPVLAFQTMVQLAPTHETARESREGGIVWQAVRTFDGREGYVAAQKNNERYLSAAQVCAP